jgi:hypothetical protein
MRFARKKGAGGVGAIPHREVAGLGVGNCAEIAVAGDAMPKKGKQETKSTSSTFKVGRDAITGRFIPVKVAQRRKATAVVETIKKSTGRKK